ncbi:MULTISPECIES: hypothetical protein [Leptospira]|nr:MULTISPECIES: hypothetical protein [Leptospira]
MKIQTAFDLENKVATKQRIFGQQEMRFAHGHKAPLYRKALQTR